jgi:hypothetical protein
MNMVKRRKVRTTTAFFNGEVTSIGEALRFLKTIIRKDSRGSSFKCRRCDGYVVAYAGGNGHENDEGAHFEHGVGQKRADCDRLPVRSST